jgi:hypothetical protein
MIEEICAHCLIAHDVEVLLSVILPSTGTRLTRLSYSYKKGDPPRRLHDLEGIGHDEQIRRSRWQEVGRDVVAGDAGLEC